MLKGLFVCLENNSRLVKPEYDFPLNLRKIFSRKKKKLKKIKLCKRECNNKGCKILVYITEENSEGMISKDLFLLFY